MEHNVYIYILIMAGVSYLIRVLPLTLIRKEIKNRTIRSFLFYVRYAGSNDFPFYFGIHKQRMVRTFGTDYRNHSCMVRKRSVSGCRIFLPCGIHFGTFPVGSLPDL